MENIIEIFKDEELQKTLVTYFSRHHQLYTQKVQGTFWEEISHKAFKRCGYDSLWESGSHRRGTDIELNGVGLSYKTGVSRYIKRADRSYYSFDKGGVHFVVLDANYNRDGSDYDHGNFNWTDPNIPAAQLEWLSADLATTKLPTICFSHQPFDGNDQYHVKNASRVRQVFQDSAKVIAVFQGHYHEGNYTLIEGSHYYTVKAVIEGSGEENNAYAVVEVDPQANITVVGYRKAVSKEMPATAVAT